MYSSLIICVEGIMEGSYLVGEFLCVSVSDASPLFHELETKYYQRSLVCSVAFYLNVAVDCFVVYLSHVILFLLSLFTLSLPIFLFLSLHSLSDLSLLFLGASCQHYYIFTLLLPYSSLTTTILCVNKACNLYFFLFISALTPNKSLCW